MTNNVANLAASIVNDQRYSELKNHIYENHGGDHATAVRILTLLQDAASEAKQHGFVEGQKPKPVEEKPNNLIDEDLDTSLTNEEQQKRR